MEKWLKKFRQERSEEETEAARQIGIFLTFSGLEQSKRDRGIELIREGASAVDAYNQVVGEEKK